MVAKGSVCQVCIHYGSSFRNFGLVLGAKKNLTFGVEGVEPCRRLSLAMGSGPFGEPTELNH